jgi:hypothetical protein
VGSSEVVDNSLAAVDIAPNAIGASELADNSVASANVIANSLTAADLAPNSVGSSELGANAVNSGSIVDGAIINADINASAAIAASKILGISGIEYNLTDNSETWADGEADARTLSSVVMTIPSNGYVLVIHSGYARMYSQTKLLYPGIGDTPTSMDEYHVMGWVTGSSTLNYYMPYCITHVYQVTPGSRTFYAIGSGNGGYATGSGFISVQTLVAIFVPERY